MSTYIYCVCVRFSLLGRIFFVNLFQQRAWWQTDLARVWTGVFCALLCSALELEVIFGRRHPNILRQCSCLIVGPGRNSLPLCCLLHSSKDRNRDSSSNATSSKVTGGRNISFTIIVVVGYDHCLQSVNCALVAFVGVAVALRRCRVQLNVRIVVIWLLRRGIGAIVIRRTVGRIIKDIEIV